MNGHGEGLQCLREQRHIGAGQAEVRSLDPSLSDQLHPQNLRQPDRAGRRPHQQFLRPGEASETRVKGGFEVAEVFAVAQSLIRERADGKRFADTLCGAA